MSTRPGGWCASLALAAILVVLGGVPARGSEPWRQLSATSPFPPAISIPMGVCDPVRQRVLVVEADLWDRATPVYEFDLAPAPHWSTLPVSGIAPLEHYLASVVYDPMRDQLLLVGSQGGRPVEVWAVTLSGTPAWQLLASTGAPRGRYGHSVVYDREHDRLVMFGGVDWGTYPTVYLSETWTFSLTSLTWTPIAPTGPLPIGREGHGALYDSLAKRMLVFGGHYEDSTRHFVNDLWQLSLDGGGSWTELAPSGPLPSARSSFGIVYDPVRRHLLVHGGVNDQSGVEPDNLWALALDGAPAWAPVATANTLRGRSYPVDAYDPVNDRLLACGGSGYPQVSALSLAAPTRWEALLPACCPLPSPGARSGHAALYDSRRDRLIVLGGSYSSADSASWFFRPEGDPHWDALGSQGAPYPGFYGDHSQCTVYDSLGDRVLMFDGRQTWCAPAGEPRAWAPIGPELSNDTWAMKVGSSAGVALDTRRNRLIVSGGYAPYPHSAGYSYSAVWALPLAGDSTWQFLGDLPAGSYGHMAFYDPIQDRMVVVGGVYVADIARFRHEYGAVAWSTPVDSALSWTQLGVAADAALPGPPNAHVAFDARAGRMFLASPWALWVREVGSMEAWALLGSATLAPSFTKAITFDPVRDQLLTLFVDLPGTSTVDAWALAVGPPAVTLLAVHRARDAVAIQWRSVTAYGRSVHVQRREENTPWQTIGPLVFGVDGDASFTDRAVQAGHDYRYRAQVTGDVGSWQSEEVFVPDPGSLRFALLGARPNPSVGSLQIAFTLPAAGPARLEVFDVHGRRLMSREVGSLGPGIHQVAIERSAGWRAGILYARLQRGTETQSTKLILLR